MYTVYFSADESCILAMYKSGTVTEAAEKIEDAVQYVDDPDMIEVMKSVLSKLNSITNEDYQKLDFSAFEAGLDEDEYEEETAEVAELEAEEA